ncbi:hypothetical protein BDR04DRAFT_1127284 [Suillus decipiens]|nr:hypothetical protein BDR04DRAFT_1127284 [Suillus decipiens]
MPDISEYVVLFHGDLGTGEHLQSAQQHRGIENTLWNRLQHVVFTSLMRDVGILWPKETGHYGSKPGFCRMHELIMYGGICRHLDCWRVEAKKCDPEWTNTQHENGLLLNRSMLQYEELSYAMNTRDIGRIETCLITWIPMFKATGKHKYANTMMDFLCKLHFVYPEGLK